MEAEIKKVTATIVSMANKLNGKNIDPNSKEIVCSEHDSRRPQMKKLPNMGAYCSLHGFHPVGLNHDRHLAVVNESRFSVLFCAKTKKQ